MSWIYSDNEFIKVYRKMLEWEWYTDSNTKALFLHCLLKANWKDGSWQGHKYKRGQFITSLSSLSKETGLSIQEVRTALEHLESTGELTSKTGSKFRIITVNSYDRFQTINKQSNNQSTSTATSYQQGANKVATTDRRTTEGKELKEIEEGPPASKPFLKAIKRYDDI